MKIVARRFLIPFSAMVIAWILIAFASVAVDEFGGFWLTERAMPFRNAHMLEEMIESEYSPIVDPIFWLFEVGVALVIFGGGTYLATKGPDRRLLWLAALPPVLGAIWVVSDIVTANVPVANTIAACVASVYAIGAFFGFRVAQ